MSKDAAAAGTGKFLIEGLSGIGSASVSGGLYGSFQLALSATPTGRSARSTTDEGDRGSQGQIWDVADLYTVA
jgi:hypothetical protein